MENEKITSFVLVVEDDENLRTPRLVQLVQRKRIAIFLFLSFLHGSLTQKRQERTNEREGNRQTDR